jgi:hypothetical protein
VRVDGRNERLNRIFWIVLKASEHIGCETIVWDSFFEMHNPLTLQNHLGMRRNACYTFVQSHP